MNIAAYVHMRRSLGNASGVGRFIANMIALLGKQPGIHLTVMAPRRELQADGSIDPASLMAGLPTAPLPASRWIMERMWWALKWPRIERWCPDADWVYCPADTFVATRKAKLAVTIHDIEAFEPDLPWSNTPQHRRFQRRWSIKLAQIYRRADRIITVSEFSRQRMIQLLGWDAGKIAVVGCGIADRFYAAAAAPDSGPPLLAGPYLLTVGGLTLRKGGPWTIAVAEELLRRKSDLKIAVAGYNDPDLARRAGQLPNLIMLGFVKDDDLPRLLKHSLALLFLSRYEGFGMPILEAMACGAPAIVSEFASLPEVAGDAGIVVDVNNAPTIADVAMSLLNHPPLREDYRQRGLKRAAAATWQACVERLLTALTPSPLPCNQGRG